MGKRALDLVVGAVLGVLALPIVAVASLAVVLDSRGAPLLRQARAGKGGHAIQVWKMRTMRRDAPRYANSPASDDDPRVTRVGRFLRRTSIDELPQLWNVLHGDMSLVGPRPAFLHHADRYTPEERERLCVPPGLTGLAQIRGRSALTWSERIALDREYVRRQGVRFDVYILAMTLWSLVRGLPTQEPSDVEPKHWRADR